MKFWQKTLVLVTATILLGACESYVDKVDEIDPTQPTDASADQVLTATEVAYIGFLEGDMARLAGMWSGYFTGTDRQYVTLYNYSATSADFDAAWANIFSSIVKNARIARQKSAAGGNRTIQGVAKVIEAHTLGMTAALWGDIPVQQAANVTEFPAPTFEPQVQVYATVQALLDEAITDLQAEVGTVTGDFLYGNDAASWIAAANTLKAKFYLHQGQYQQAVTAASNGIVDPANNLLAPHGNSYQQNFNLYYSFGVYDRPGYMSANPFVYELFERRSNSKTNETSRQRFYFVEGPDLNYTSADYDGSSAEETGFFGADHPFPLITFEENQLILAEASARLGQTDAALMALNRLRTYYDAGGYIRPAYRALGLNYDPYTLADFQAGGLENSAGGITTDQALLQEILEERYLTLIGQLEAYNDIRRTNNAIGVPPNVPNGQVPRRFLYAQNEINANPNVPKPVPNLYTPTPIFK